MTACSPSGVSMPAGISPGSETLMTLTVGAAWAAWLMLTFGTMDPELGGVKSSGPRSPTRIGRPPVTWPPAAKPPPKSPPRKPRKPPPPPAAPPPRPEKKPWMTWRNSDARASAASCWRTFANLKGSSSRPSSSGSARKPESVRWAEAPTSSKKPSRVAVSFRRASCSSRSVSVSWPIRAACSWVAPAARARASALRASSSFDAPRSSISSSRASIWSSNDWESSEASISSRSCRWLSIEARANSWKAAWSSLTSSVGTRSPKISFVAAASARSSR